MIRVYLTSVAAIILILKHATFLCLSNMASEVALTQAELDYQEANVDLIIQQHLTAFSHWKDQSVEQFFGFIMATDIGLFLLILYLSSYYLIKFVQNPSTRCNGLYVVVYFYLYSVLLLVSHITDNLLFLV